MNISGLSAYVPYVNKITGYLDSQMAAAQQSIDELHRLSASYEVKISDYGMIQSNLSSLESAARKLSGPDAFSLYSARSSDSATLTAYAQKNASPGTYRVEVSQLARGETLVSAALQSPSAAIGNGSLSAITFQFASGASQSIAIDQSNNALPGIAAAINRADFGVFASVAFDGSAFRLVLHGPPGSSNAFNIGVSGEEAVARLLSYSNGATENAMTRAVAAQDSQGSVNGTPFAGHGNVVTGAAAGLTLNLNRTGQAVIAVATDMARITGAVQAFVDAYNSAQGDLAMYRTGELPDDRLLAAIGNRLSEGLEAGQAGSGTPHGSLEQIGIMRNRDGTLILDTLVFQDAYSRDPSGVARLFTDNGSGLADRISSQLQSVLRPGGSISSAIDQWLSKIRKNQQMESYIENNAIHDLEHSAHRYAQQLSMMIVAQIVNQFMQGLSSQPGRSPEEASGMLLPRGMGVGSSNAIQVNRLNIAPGVAELGMLTSNTATQYHRPRLATGSGNQA